MEADKETTIRQGKFMYETKDNNIGFYMCIGISIGTSLGMIIFNNMNMGMYIGMVIGCLIGIKVKVKVCTNQVDFLEYMAREVVEIKPYLEETEYIDYSNSNIRNKADELLQSVNNNLKEKYPNEYEAILFFLKNINQDRYGMIEERNSLRQKWIESNLGKEDKITRKYWKNVESGLEEYINQITKAFYEFVRDEIKFLFDIDSDIVPAKASEVLDYRVGNCDTKSNLLAAMLRYVNIPCGLSYEHLTLKEDDSKGYILHCINAVYICGQWFFLDTRKNKEEIDTQFEKGLNVLQYIPREEYDEYFIKGIYVDAHKETMKILQEANSISDILDKLPEHI